jgi:excisionase family DNA binding protein
MTKTTVATVWLTREEAADRLRVSPRTVDRYATEGKLAKHKLAGTQSVRFRAADVDALVQPSTE